MGLKVKNFSGKNHRTALVIDVSDGLDSDYSERVSRLLASVGGSNIKVDIFAQKNDTLTQVSSLSDIKAVAGVSSFTADGADSVREWAAEAGYTQVLVNSPV